MSINNLIFLVFTIFLFCSCDNRIIQSLDSVRVIIQGKKDQIINKKYYEEKEIDGYKVFAITGPDDIYIYFTKNNIIVKKIDIDNNSKTLINSLDCIDVLNSNILAIKYNSTPNLEIVLLIDYKIISLLKIYCCSYFYFDSKSNDIITLEYFRDTEHQIDTYNVLVNNNIIGEFDNLKAPMVVNYDSINKKIIFKDLNNRTIDIKF